MQTHSIQDHPSYTNRILKNSHKLIAIEGSIGVGKTSLARMLSSRWQSANLLEVFEENPFLTGGFYDNQKVHGFNTEVFFLLSRFRQLKDFAAHQGLAVMDYFFEKNIIFANANLEAKDLEIYRSVYDRLIPEVKKPDLVVYLKADVETLLRRIYFRDRSFERGISSDYIQKLNRAYENFFGAYHEAPILSIDTSSLDFVNEAEDFRKLSAMIEDRLSGQIQLSLLKEA